MRTAKMLAIAVVTFYLVNSVTAGWVTPGNNMYSDVSGYVGIGTTSPIAELHLGGTYTSLQMGSSTTPTDNFHFVNEKVGANPIFNLYNGNVGGVGHDGRR
jgi:hypothetical protein